jgi:hypothetical protein
MRRTDLPRASMTADTAADVRRYAWHASMTAPDAIHPPRVSSDGQTG